MQLQEKDFGELGLTNHLFISYYKLIGWELVRLIATSETQLPLEAPCLAWLFLETLKLFDLRVDFPCISCKPLAHIEWIMQSHVHEP